LNLPPDRFARLPRVGVLLIGLVVVVLVAWLDFLTGSKVSLNLFYLLPVMVVTWLAGTSYGLFVALATFAAGPLEEYLAGFRYMSLAVATWNACLRLAVFCIVILLLAQLRKVVERLQEAALVDPLTGLANRRAFHEEAAREIERSKRYNHELSLAYVDLDDFKALNDRLGHAAGDKALVALAALVRATARSVDTVARIGGDEIVVLMPETGAGAALRLAERLRTSCSRATGPGDARATCSIGLVTFGHPPATVEEMLAKADELMYQAKAAGGNRIQSSGSHECRPPRALRPARALSVRNDSLLA
jgi:diguanylate cyclase (GGDEF)-like protein